MKPYPFIVSALALLLTISSCDNDEEKEKPDPCVTTSSVGGVIIDQYIVSLPAEEENPDGRKSARAVSVLTRNNLSQERIINHFRGRTSIYILNINSTEAEQLKADGDVLKIEQDKTVSLCTCLEVVEPRLITWNVDKVGYGDGTGKRAWILDSGVDLDHPDLNIDTELSRSFVPDFPTAEDGEGHGTHSAGIIGALNNDFGTLGVASGATIIALKVLDDDGNGTVGYILDALAFISEHGKAGDVVNLSLSVDKDVSTILDDEVKALANRGFFVSIAAGNDGESANNFSPARANAKNVYTVSAVDSLDRFASFSNFGNDAVDFAAPGVRIPSTYRQGLYARATGTSQAAPHVAGILLINNGKVNSIGNALSDPDGTADPLAHK
jgi:subtilisin